MRVRFYVLPLLLLAAACGSKYPYPPQYLSPGDVSERAIPAPPIKDSAEYDAALDSILVIQKKLTPEELAAMHHQDQIRPEVIVQPILGAGVTEATHPALYTLLKHAASDAWRIRDVTADYWHSPRPWYADPRVALHVEPIYAYGYPSGHTTTFGVWAHILSDLYPAHADRLFEFAWGVANNRIKGGAHFPFDIEGGKRLAWLIYDRMTQVPQFRQEFDAAKMETMR